MSRDLPIKPQDTAAKHDASPTHFGLVVRNSKNRYGFQQFCIEHFIKMLKKLTGSIYVWKRN